MKISLSVDTIRAANGELLTAVQAVMKEAFNIDEKALPQESTPDAGIEAFVAATEGLKNISVRVEGDQLVYELDDGLLLGYIRIYAKIVRFLVPFIKPLYSICMELKGDLAALHAALMERK